MDKKRSVKKSLLIISLLTTAVLSIPLIAMQFSEEVDWKLPDFIIVGALLFSAGTVCDIATRRITSKRKLITVLAIIVFAMLFIYIELAVGLVGSPIAGS